MRMKGENAKRKGNNPWPFGKAEEKLPPTHRNIHRRGRVRGENIRCKRGRGGRIERGKRKELWPSGKEE